MKTNERKTSVITEDAFKDSNDFTVNSPAICLDLTDKSLEDTKEYALIPHIFKFRVFESLKDVPNIPHKSWEYIYVIEVDNGKFIKVGYTKDVKKRLKTHLTDKDSPIAGRCK